MKLTALYYDEAKRHHWIVKWLRFLGYCLIFSVEILSLAYGTQLLTPMVQQMLGTNSPFVQMAVMILCGVGGIFAGIILGLPWWGLSMLLDDLHAIRLQTAAYVSQDQEDGHAH